MEASKEAVKTLSKDPVCGMSVNPSTAIHAEREGETFYFCGEPCRKTFLSTPVGAKPAKEEGSCCG